MKFELFEKSLKLKSLLAAYVSNMPVILVIHREPALESLDI